MIIERTNKELIIRLLPTVDTVELQEMANYFRYKEITSKFNSAIAGQIKTLYPFLKAD